MPVKCPECLSENTDAARFCSSCAAPLKGEASASQTETLISPFDKGNMIAGKYKIIEKVGAGGMGVVYKAEDTRLKRTVALKFLPPGLTRDKKAKERFIQEAQAAAALEHPNICTVFEVEETEDQTFIAMSFVKGQSLKNKIESGPISLREAEDIAVQISEGLKEAHDKGIVHRDIKPANIMLTEKGQAKIVDFGIAKLAGQVRLTQTGTTMGTVVYMSPEQVEGKDVDQRSDIYSLGVIFYEMITGNVPFEGDTPLSIAYKHKHELPPDPKKTNDQIPEAISRIVLKCLEKNRENRFQNMDELLSEIASGSLPAAFSEGVVTTLIVDIEASEAQLADLKKILKAVFEKSEGKRIPKDDDTFLFAFPRAADAVAAAVKAQHALAADVSPDTAEIPICIALHTGPSDTGRGDIDEVEKHRAALIAGAGHGGQVLLSETTAPLVKDELPEGVDIADLGEHRLKDLRRPERVYQLVILGLQANFPVLKSLDARPNNLPIQSTSLIGRDADLVSVRELFSQAGIRLLTLIGPGGTGKTRLGLQLAAELSEEFTDGVFYVPLSPIADSGLVTSTLAQTLGVRDHGNQPIFETLKEFLQSKKMLLLLDSFEHVSDAAPEVSLLLETCPLIKFLVTSREALHVKGEHEFLVSPLAFPDISQKPDSDVLKRNPSVELFFQRAQAVKPGFEISDENAEAVAEICARLDGLPLALELAAARIKLFPPKALLKRLLDADAHSSLQILSRGPRDAPERHRTLRSAMDWSYKLLDENEQGLLQMLSVFAGGFTLSAAESVCCFSEESVGMDVMEGLSSLLDKSLLRQDERGEEETRFAMLGLIREYSSEKLKESGREAEARQKHAHFFQEFVEEAKPMLEGPEQDIWLDRLEEEHNNLRSALEWLLQQSGSEKKASAAVESCLRMAGTMALFWDTHGYVNEGRSWLKRILALCDVKTNGMIDTLIGAAWLAARQSDMAEANRLYDQAIKIARQIDYKAGIAKAIGGLIFVKEFLGADDEFVEELYSESLDLWREVGDKRGIATALGPMAQRAASGYDFEQANKLFEESLSLFREVQDKREIAGALWNLGQIAAATGNYDEAKERYEESHKIYKDLKDLHGVATQLRGIGKVERYQGSADQARSLYEESLESFRSMGDKGCATIAIAGLGRVLLDQGDVEKAVELAQECLSLSREISFKSVEAQALRLLGQCEFFRGDQESSRKYFIESLSLEKELDHHEGIAENLEGIASVSAAQAEFKQALKIFSAAEVLRTSLGIPLPPADEAGLTKWKKTAMKRLSGAESKSAKEEGSALSMEQAIELAKVK
jgi:predicted ATPase/serine/threonine protein kinase